MAFVKVLAKTGNLIFKGEVHHLMVLDIEENIEIYSTVRKLPEK